MISVSSLKEALEAGREFKISATEVNGIKGYFLNLNEGFGFDSVMFELGDADNGA